MALHIGTSGWHYGHWKHRFYPESIRENDFLSYYAKSFRTVEINSSFYRLPTERAVETWKTATPPRFCFAVKASRYITHMKKLTDPRSSFQKFFERVRLLGPKLGPVLFQLPPWWGVNFERLAAFVKTLPPGSYTFEFREPSWFNERVEQLLQDHGISTCIFDIDGKLSPVLDTADFVYVRLHGPGPRYQGAYPPAQLRQWAARLQAWQREKSNVYAYFDNDNKAYAIENARELSGMVGGEYAAPTPR